MNDFGGTMEASQSDFSSTGTGASFDGGSAGLDGAAIGAAGLAAALAAQPAATISFMGLTAGPPGVVAAIGIGAAVGGFLAADLAPGAPASVFSGYPSGAPGDLASAIANGSGYGAFTTSAGSFASQPADGSVYDPRNFASSTGSEGGGG